MTVMSLHGEWLSLMDISGPFLAEPVLKDAFPQGLEEVEPKTRKLLRQAYDEWRDALELADDDLAELHGAWIDLVLRQGLELDDDGSGDILKTVRELPDKLSQKFAERGVTLQPDYAVVDDQNSDKSLMLISVYDPTTDLNEPLKSDGWAASPAERMVELCRAKETRLGLVTNGEHWMLVDAPVGATTTFASWYARLWSPEPKTLQSFINLLGVRRFFVASDEQLPALLDASLKLQDEVTEALGEQVRRAVEVLIQALDRADVDRNRELLTGIEPTSLYEAGLTVMMRIVFLLSAEERGLLLLGDERYEANYAVSTLRMQLRGESEEILERRFDAWARLLAIFRAVYGGIDHEDMRLPALGGSLFDPNRFPFLEGRAKSSDWRVDHAIPLPIDNRTVLLLLDAVQLFQGRTLSYRALDVEQIGYVYEGLLERTVVRAEDVTLDLDATKSAKKSWVTLEELEAAKATSDDALAALLKERTGSSTSRIKNDLAKTIDVADADQLLTACHSQVSLRDRIKPYFHFLRIDRWNYPLVYPVGTFMVITGTDRRETGTHYTPKSLTEAVVKETLEPLAYAGPADGKQREDWVLKSPAELLNLKICDPAMGSGAFLVQVCRWVSDRLVEAWRDAEEAGMAVTAGGAVVEKENGYEPLRDDPEERLLTARRLVAERCLYGVDVNPLAVELAKLSIWLITLAKGRPFGFLDHNLRSGDSLLGVQSIHQILNFDYLLQDKTTKNLFGQKVSELINEAVQIRNETREHPIIDITDVQRMVELNEKSRGTLKFLNVLADCLTGEFFAKGGVRNEQRKLQNTLSIEAQNVIDGDSSRLEVIRRRADSALALDPPKGRSQQTPFHWFIEFPEVFFQDDPGFDAILGNPPFLWALRISMRISTTYGHYLKRIWPHAKKNADLCAYFLLRSSQILKRNGTAGFVTTNTISEADTRETCLDYLEKGGFEMIAAHSDVKWPGSANVRVSTVLLFNGQWEGERLLDGKIVKKISSRLDNYSMTFEANPLRSNKGKCFKGSVPLGDGFFVTEDEVKILTSRNKKNEEVLFPFLNGKELNSSPTQSPGRWVIYFRDWALDKCYDYPDCLNLVEQRVKPERDKIVPKNNMAKQRKELWWKFTGPTVDLYDAIKGKNKVLVCSAVSKHHIVTFAPSNYIFSNALNVFDFDDWYSFGVLQSTIHNIWALANGSRLETRPRYNVSDCFETFPFPKNAKNNALSGLASEYYEARQAVMEQHQFGLTTFYNEFHDPDCLDSAIVACREFHKRIDEEVLDAYELGDINPNIDFHDVGYLPENKNTRFTVSEDARQKILARLAMINKDRHEAEKKPTLSSKIPVPKSDLNELADDLFSPQEGTG